MSELFARSVDSPLGALQLVATEDSLVGVSLPSERPAAWAEASVRAAHPVLDQAARELAEYFRGERAAFALPLAFGGTPFQRSVWEALLTIGFGERRSYRWVAEQVGRPRAVRAVGAANGRNVLAIVVPCHRVIGVDRSLTGYAGGIEVKQWLLEHERRVVASLRPRLADGPGASLPPFASQSAVQSS